MSDNMDLVRRLVADAEARELWMVEAARRAARARRREERARRREAMKVRRVAKAARRAERAAAAFRAMLEPFAE